MNTLFLQACSMVSTFIFTSELRFQTCVKPVYAIFRRLDFRESPFGTEGAYIHDIL